MLLDTDTFLAALYTICDDLYRQYCLPHKPRRPGRRPEASDSEIITLALRAQWLGFSERKFLRYACRSWQAYFPRIPSQSAFNRRCRDLWGALTELAGRIAQELAACAAPYQALDTTALPLLRRCRGQRQRLFAEEAAIGRGGSDRDWYYGCKLLLAVTPAGVITGFLAAPASTEDRWLADAFLRWRRDPSGQPATPEQLPPSHRNKGRYVGPTGPRWPRQGAGEAADGPYVADKGFRGRWWEAHWRRDYGATVLPPKALSTVTAKEQRRWRQVVEQVNGFLKNGFHLAFPQARRWWGLRARLAAKIAAYNAGVWLNGRLGRPDLALSTLFSW